MSFSEHTTESFSLTPEQSDEYEALLWEKAEQVGELRISIQAQVEVMYAEIEAKRDANPNLHEQELLSKEEGEYWVLYQQLQEIIGVEKVILQLLEQIEEGSASKEEILSSLPSDVETPSDEEIKESKRKQAVAREKRFTPETTYTYLGEAGLLYLFGGNSFRHSRTQATDPRRIASGRNKKKVTSGNGMSEFDFYEATADTHGGKTRHIGKLGKAYVGKNGKRIRKY
jgi:hypothetical protein